MIGVGRCCSDYPHVAEVGYEEIDQPLVDDRVYGRGSTMNGYAIVVRYDA